MAQVALNSSPRGPVTSYSNVALAGSGKQGKLKQLDNGYCEIILGAFGAFGNGGWLYDTASAMRYMENDPEFLRMLQAGRLRSEWGHPRRLPGMSDQDWFVRICEIMENNVSSHIRRVSASLDTVVDERGRKVVAIIGEVRGTGPKSREFNEMLENPDEDVNYSIRCFAKKNFGNMTKSMTKIITWDSVYDPGIAVASKYKTPSLESKQYVGQLLDEAEFNLERLRMGFDACSNDSSFESMAPAVQILNSLYEETRVSIAVPRSLSW
jgi:hypothetical protein